MARKLLPMCLPILVLLALIIVYYVHFNGKVYPNIFVSNNYLGGTNSQSALQILSNIFAGSDKLTLTTKDKSFDIKFDEIGLIYNLNTSVDKAISYGRTEKFPINIINSLKLIFEKQNFRIYYNVDNTKLQNKILAISKLIDIPAKKTAIYVNNSKIIIDNGGKGQEVDQTKLKDLIYNSIEIGDKAIVVPINVIDNTLSPFEIENLKTQVEKYLGKSILFKFEYQSFKLGEKEIIDMLNPIADFDNNKIDEFIQKITNSVNRPFQNAKFIFENGKIVEFAPARDGITVDKTSLTDQIISLLQKLPINTEKQIELEIPVIRTLPEISTSEVNNLGIKEIIGSGSSTYYHSIPSRVHNVTLASSRINGTLVSPGETFSFNKTLGDVSQFTGYQQAYVISEGKTILGDGGGVCQVSSTLFRAVLNAGLPVEERRSHAYRVGYYEQGSPPGMDATVYSPTTDFKFTNNTGSYILIQTISDPKNYSLIFELYGTKDGRIATITKPIISNISSPLPDTYQDDPNLPVGVIRQVDYKAWGAKVSFDYKVERDGEVIYSKSFISNYRPWGAVYLKGTKI